MRGVLGEQEQGPTQSVGAGFVACSEDHSRVADQFVFAQARAVFVVRVEQHRQHVAAAASVFALETNHFQHAAIDVVREIEPVPIGSQR